MAASLILKSLIPLALLAAAAFGAWQILSTPPGADRAERPRIARLVEVVRAEPAARGPLIEAWGEVVPARRLMLRAETPGRVTELNPDLAAGGEVAAGELLFAVDERELAAALAGAEAEIAEIRARILIERGQAARAGRDLERVPLDLTGEQRALVLREPQMAGLEAELAAAEAARDRAAVALAEARMVAPFDALVLDESISEGTMLTTGAEVATLVATDRFEVRLAVPVSALDWLDFRAGGEVVLTQPGAWGPGETRTGRIARLVPGLTETGRMAEVIVTVDDPLSLEPANAGKPRLLIGSFLRAITEGREVEGAVRLDRAALRDGNTVWVMTGGDRLEIRPVRLAWRGADEVLVAEGLAPGERVVTTQLATVADGMALRLDGEAGTGAR